MKTMLVLIATAGALLPAPLQDTREMPRPQREHALLKQFEGEWEATAQPFGTTKESDKTRGSETARMGYGGIWLVIDHRGDHVGKPFEGHGTMGFDPRRKKYVMTWIDNFAPYAMWAEGDADAAGKVFTFTSDGSDPQTGKTIRVRTVHEVKDADHRTLSFYAPGRDGPERKLGEIVYERKK